MQGPIYIIIVDNIKYKIIFIDLKPIWPSGKHTGFCRNIMYRGPYLPNVYNSILVLVTVCLV